MSSWKMTLMVSALVGAMWGVAAGEGVPVTNYRCDAAKLRADSREAMCKAHCEQQSESKSADQRADWTATCLENCHTRCDRDKTRIERGPACITVPDQPDPERCAGKLLSALAQYNFCLSECPDDASAMVSDLRSDRVPRSVACRERCNGNYSATSEKVKADPICAKGNIPVCMYQ